MTKPTIQSFFQGTHTIYEVIDYVYAQLKQQGRPGMTGDDIVSLACAYRTEDGCKCAIGHIVSDDDYNSNLQKHIMDHLEYMEGNIQACRSDFNSLAIDDYIHKFLNVYHGNKIKIQQLCELQLAHDNAALALIQGKGTFIELLEQELFKFFNWGPSNRGEQ